MGSQQCRCDLAGMRQWCLVPTGYQHRLDTDAGGRLGSGTGEGDVVAVPGAG